MRINDAGMQIIIDFVATEEERERVNFDHLSNPTFGFTKHSSTLCIWISSRYSCLFQINCPLCEAIFVWVSPTCK